MIVYVCDGCGHREKSCKVAIESNGDRPVAIPIVPPPFKTGIFNISKQDGPPFDGFLVCSQKCADEMVQRKGVDPTKVRKLCDEWEEDEPCV